MVELFLNVSHLKEYQDGFIKKELLEGKAAEDGAVSKMYYKYGNRDMILTETVTRNNLPDTFESRYHHMHMDNTMKCIFTEISEKKPAMNTNLNTPVSTG